MLKRININFINIDNKYLYEIINNTILIKITNDYDIVVFINKYYILYNINENIIYNKYFIEINNNDFNINILSTLNFIINIPSNIYFIYDYYNNELDKSIIFFNYYNYYEFVFMGLPNLISSLEVEVNYEYNSILNNSTISSKEKEYIFSLLNINTEETNQILMLFNNFNGNYNYLNNTIILYGWIYELIIPDNAITDNNLNLYKLFQIKNNLYLNSETKIYFYNDSKLFSYILYLNTYSNLEYNESIILMIEYDNLNVSENTTQNENETIYFSVLSLNLQLFNSKQLSDDNNIEYYNSLFFKNYINDNYYVKSISMFDYDYIKYFVNNLTQPEFYNIQNYTFDLYDKIIANDINLTNPQIFQISNSYFFINLDSLNLIKLINFNSENNYFNKFLKSNKINLDTIVNYLAKFEFKKYNIYKINNYYNENTDKTDKLINFNNNIMNSIICNIVFLYFINENYSINGKLFLDNYNIQIYHKKYNIDNNNDKKNLVRMLIFLATVCWGIKIIFENNLKLYNSYYYLFNQINLNKQNKLFNIDLNIIPIDNNYTNQYIKFNINIKLNYYILFLYSDKTSILNNYNELVFIYLQFIFKIFKIQNPNGNLYENRELFYIVFQNLTELNIFFKYIETGIFNINPNNLLNYFNIEKSVIFSNYYTINNYWMLDNLPEPINTQTSLNKYNIYFSINNLYINQIYLFGELFIKSLD